MNRLHLLLGVALILCATSAAQASDVDRLAELLKRARTSKAPSGVAFLIAFRHEGDLDLDAQEIQTAVARSRIPQGSEVAQIALAIDRIEKQGDQITIRRSKAEDVDMGQGWMRLSTTSTFRIADGEIADLPRKTRKRLGLESGTYVRLHEIKGVKVGLSTKLMIGLSAFYYVEDRGRPKLAGQAGIGFAKAWKTVWLERNPRGTRGLVGRLPE